MKYEGMDKRNRGVNDKGDSLLTIWKLQEERELRAATQKATKKRGKTTHRENTDTRSHTHTN